MTDPAEVAAKLTEAQREEVLSLSGEWRQRRWSGQQPPWAVWLPPSILEQATPTRVDAQRLRLTPLGLSVRAVLQEKG
jgi:hypothetical protein